MKFRLSLAAVLHLILCVAPMAAATFYVAPDGNDGWSGRLASANGQRTDGPWASLARARDAVRAIRAAGTVREPVDVLIGGGVYRMEKTLEFGPEDSGTAEAPITYAALPGQRPVLSGGRPIGGWQKAEGPLWQTTVPGVKEGQWYFHQLFVEGHRRTRARTPNQGFLYTEGILEPFDRAKWYEASIAAKTGFLFCNDDIRHWQNFDDALVVIYHSWTTSIHFITELDTQQRRVKLAPVSTWPIGYWWEYNTRYHVENIREALDEPGEWYLDRKTGTLVYWPMPGEDMTKAQAIAPAVRQTLVAFRGDPANKKYVEHLRFRGLSFQHADCVIARDMPTDQQGAAERAPAIDARGLRHAVFDDCEIAHVGENGLWLDAACSDNVVRRCHVHDLGGGALFVGARNYQGTPETAVERNVIDNNWLHDGSHIFRGSQGMWLGKISHNEATHNEISDFHHLGISVGHSWGYAPSTAHHNLVAFNHVHHICNGYFSDGGGIYCLGISPGTQIRNNLVHDVVPTPLMPVGGCGIYLDEGSSEILVENNVVYDVGAAAFTQHYGRENVCRNNVFAFGGRDPVCCARPEEHLSYTFEGNIVLSSAGQATSDHFSPLKAKTAFDRNLYWDTSGKAPLFSGVPFAEWQKTGRDRNSRIADPRFVDPTRRDFHLQPTSPALAMGFRPIPVEQVGLYGDPAWTAAPGKVARPPLPALPPPPAPPPPRPMKVDFETAAVGSRPALLSCSPDDRPDSLGVTEEAAAGGKRALRFTKTPGLKYGFQPHAFFSSDRYVSGKVRFACDVMSSAAQPAEFCLGLRDYTQKGREYADGPLVFFRADGDIVVGGKTLAKVPPGLWLHLEIQVETRAGTAGSKSFRLAIQPAGGPPIAFEALPMADPAFSQFTWFGFSSSGKPGSVFYVDNIELELRDVAAP